MQQKYTFPSAKVGLPVQYHIRRGIVNLVSASLHPTRPRRTVPRRGGKGTFKRRRVRSTPGR